MKDKTLSEKIRRKKRSSFKEYFKQNYLLYVLLLPLIVYLLIFSYYPMLGIQIAFKDWRIRGGIWGSPWATTDGALDLLKHFKLLFGDSLFLGKFINTLRISTLKLLCGFCVPILLTVLLNEMLSTTCKRICQTVMYLPYFISWVIISGILFSITESGTAFQTFLKAIFGKEIYFFSDDDLFIVMVVLSDIWKNAGWGTIIYFAAMSGIAPELYEAATMDGAGRLKRIWYITLPGLMPAITINLIFSVSGLVYGGFDQIFNMYNTTVYGKGDILETYLYRIGIAGGSYDVATALGLFNSLLSLVLILAANFTVKKIGGEGIW